MLRIEAPAVENPIGGLLSVVPTKTAPAGTFVKDGVVFRTTAHGVPVPVPTDGSEKVFEEGVDVSSATFAIYKGVESSLFEQDDFTGSVVERYFERGESIAVERAIESEFFASATDVTPVAETPVTDPREAVGLLEQWAAENYLGRPLLHANRLNTAHLRDLEVSGAPNWELHTQQGTRIVNGGGYSGDRLWITGGINIWRSNVEAVDGRHLYSNRQHSLVEAQYAATVNQVVASVLVDF